MPLVKGRAARTKKGISENIRREVKTGRSKEQAIAIAYNIANNSKRRRRKKEK
jgi:hypothetical protein